MLCVSLLWKTLAVCWFWIKAIMEFDVWLSKEWWWQDMKDGLERGIEKEMDAGIKCFALFRLMDLWCRSLRIDGSLMMSANGRREAERRDRRRGEGEWVNKVFILSFGNRVEPATNNYFNTQFNPPKGGWGWVFPWIHFTTLLTPEENCFIINNVKAHQLGTWDALACWASCPSHCNWLYL